jgi:hypothetical protein
VAHSGGLRASDEDRERIAERLRAATAEGRLLTDELDERLGIALSARTYGELDSLVADLPGGVDRRRRLAPRPVLRTAIVVAISAAVLLVMLAAVVFVLTGIFTLWVLWAVLGWWFFGHRRRACVSRPGRSLHSGGRWYA